MTTDNFDIAPLLLLPLGRFYLNVNARTNLREGDLTAALRSRLGEILKGRFCTCMDFRKAACPGCVRETSCLYLQLFAPTPACLDAACLGEGRRPPTHPARPYMLRALGPGKDDRIPTGKRGRVELTLLGERAIACARPMLESVLHAAASLTPSAVEAGTPRSDAPVLEVLGWEAEVPQKTRGAWEIAVMEESVIARQVPSAPLEEWLRALPGQTALDQESQRLGVCFETPVQSRRFERGITFPDLLKGIMARLRDLKGIYHPDCDMASLPPEFFKL
ncbi:MAG: hypothetical protein GY737_24785, partial [Desulfobacteraceae bacterium]|nr:hypothetical protein [Desulfobacteraceae bacterium]